MWKPYTGSKSSWQLLGLTPVDRRRLPRGPVRVRLRLPGYVPVEAAAPDSEYHVKLQRDDSSFLVLLSNFGKHGPIPVGSSGAVGSFGAFDMAGNVREWCWNQTGGQRYILGGSWTDPQYMLTRGQAAPPFDRSQSNGFRCVRYTNPARVLENLGDRIKPTPLPDYRRMRPVRSDTFQVYRSLFAYEKSNLSSAVDSVDERLDLWRREKIRFNAAYGNERMTAYLFLPRDAKPPYQCVVFFPSDDALAPGSGEAIRPETYILRTGRAMLYPIYKGTYERCLAIPRSPIGIRDATIVARKDLGRSIDYLETRKDIDPSKLAYLGISMGAEIAPVLLALEDRIKVAVLLSGGFSP